MTKRPNGINLAAELRDHIAEPVQPSHTATADTPAEVIEDDANDQRVWREIAWLQKEIGDLRAAVIQIQNDRAYRSAVEVEDHPWLRVLTTAAASLVLGKLAQRFRLGVIGAAAVPLLITRLNRRLW
ncbi:MAG: hypothetical protein ACK4QP_18895 [Pseudorhizobium sp.]